MKCLSPIHLLRDNKASSPYRLDIFDTISLSGANNMTEKSYRPPLYTTETKDTNGLVSAHRVYMDSTSEYEVAIKLVGSWDHWQYMLQHSKKVRLMIEDWREEKDLLDKTTAKELLWISAQKGSVTAQKALYEYRKQEIKVEKLTKRQQAQKASEEEEDQRETELLRERLKRVTRPSIVNG